MLYGERIKTEKKAGYDFLMENVPGFMSVIISGYLAFINAMMAFGVSEAPLRSIEEAYILPPITMLK